MSTERIKQRRLRQRGLLLFGCLIALLAGWKAASAETTAGEFGADIGFLKSQCSGPQTACESNFYIDMWQGRTLRGILSLNGLTNNRTLFVNSHGREISGGRFAFYPHQSLVASAADLPCYSPRDLAVVIGTANSPLIHNIVLAACNAEGALSARELRKHFPNATNIVHSPPGELGYQAMFVQAMVNGSWNIEPLYESREQNEKGQFEYVTGPAPAANAKRFAPYIAELFKPGHEEPFRVQRAGRELLDPNRARTLTTAR